MASELEIRARELAREMGQLAGEIAAAGGSEDATDAALAINAAILEFTHRLAREADPMFDGAELGDGGSFVIMEELGGPADFFSFQVPKQRPRRRGAGSEDTSTVGSPGRPILHWTIPPQGGRPSCPLRLAECPRNNSRSGGKGGGTS